LKDRAILKYLIQSGGVKEAKAFLTSSFPAFYEGNLKVQAYLDALDFIELVSRNVGLVQKSPQFEANMLEAVAFGRDKLNKFMGKDISFPSRDREGQVKDLQIC